jgi:hypothetical protein
MLRRTVCLLRVASLFKAALIRSVLDSWIMCCQDNFDFAKTQISVQQILILIIKKTPATAGA